MAWHWIDTHQDTPIRYKSFRTANLCFVRSFDTDIASRCFAQKSASIVLLQTNADIDCQRFDSPSHGCQAWWGRCNRRSFKPLIFVLIPHGGGGRVYWLVVAWAKWCPIPNFSSQLAPNYQLWSIHCYRPQCTQVQTKHKKSFAATTPSKRLVWWPQKL